MNHLLASALKTLNAFAAILVIAGAAISGALAAGANGASFIMGALLGLLIGFVISVVVFGTLALIIDIRSELISLNARLTAQNSRQ